MPGTVLSMQNIYLVKKNYANPPEGDTKPPEDSASMKFVYHQLNAREFSILSLTCRPVQNAHRYSFWQCLAIVATLFIYMHCFLMAIVLAHSSKIWLFFVV